jgi:RNA polymerase sigma-70 factor (ECF subfamily)
LTDDSTRADAIVEETIARARHTHQARGTTATVQLLSMLRSVYAEELAANEPRNVVVSTPVQPSGQLGSTASVESNSVSPDDLVSRFFKLPIEQREVLALVAVERLAYEEIGTLLGVPVATVFARLVQAREALRAADQERSTQASDRS